MLGYYLLLIAEKSISYLFCFPSHPAGGSIDSDCAFEGDYTVPPLSMTEGMQHIRIMEGVSRSLPSSPLLTHQTISVRLQPVKKLTGKRTAVKLRFIKIFMCCHILKTCVWERKAQPTEMWAKSGSNMSCTHTSLPVTVLPHRLIVLIQPPLTLHCTTAGRVPNHSENHTQ